MPEGWMRSFKQIKILTPKFGRGWADAVQTDIFEQVTKLKKPVLHDDEEREIREMLDDTN